ncbi:MAG TPA: UDP-2,3-diacylglucosamine diphosphatase LpxI [Kiritimatiellia bacterium]|nr:UDP-2,3-diacylglucosamine diphosphatase LpxI [Kiritimatiellia bacterium]HMP33153.1 UDP-2,3-diacylglucosamine diphosphatase LpxI [Kiritimatiellia bacterium]
MTESTPDSLSIIAGRGAYPRVLAESARKQGVSRIAAVAFKKETDAVIEKVADEVTWVHIGQLQAMLDALVAFRIPRVVMAGQIKPTHLFNIRPDKRMFDLLARLKERNAETIFGAVGEELKSVGIELLQASRFMESTMPEPGPIGHLPPTPQQWDDIRLGLRVAKATSGLDIGQTVVIKEGTVLAVEAFEGTDATILRAGELGGPGSVVVKVAKRGHDMRFDIPVIGERTFDSMKKSGAAVLAVEARRSILLDREALVKLADRRGVAFLAVEMES